MSLIEMGMLLHWYSGVGEEAIVDGANLMIAGQLLLALTLTTFVIFLFEQVAVNCSAEILHGEIPKETNDVYNFSLDLAISIRHVFFVRKFIEYKCLIHSDASLKYPYLWSYLHNC